MTSIRRPGNTGITGGIKGINNKVPKAKTEEKAKKPHADGWKPHKQDKPTQTPTKPGPMR